MQVAMELGCDGVLVNTAIAKAKNPVVMANAMKLQLLLGGNLIYLEELKSFLGNASSLKLELFRFFFVFFIKFFFFFLVRFLYFLFSSNLIILVSFLIIFSDWIVSIILFF